MSDIISVIDDLFANDSNYVDLSKVDTSVKEWVDSGNYALNFIMSGSFTKGIPVGRITIFDGLPGTGKSLFLASCLRDSTVEMGMIFETEGGGFSKELLDFMEVDAKKVRQKKVRSYDCFKRNKAGDVEEIKDTDFNPKDPLQESGLIWNTRKVLDLIPSNNLKGKFLLGVDSMANLTSAKEISGSLDMGKRNQLSNKFFRLFDNMFEKMNIACVMTNKLYTNVTAGQYEEKYMASGGVSVEYNPSLIVRLERVSNSNSLSASELVEEKENMKSSRGASIVTIKAKVTKSRFGTYGRQVILNVDFNKGVIRESGLYSIVDDYGLLEKSGAWNSFKNKEIHDGKFYRKDFEKLITKEMLEKIEKEINTKEADKVVVVSEKEKEEDAELDSLIKEIDKKG